MNEWMTQGGGAQDVLDDANLNCAIRSFLDNRAQHTAPASPAFNNFTVQQAWSAYEQSRKSFMSSFVALTMRPPSRDTSAFKPPVSNVETLNLGSDPPDIDRIDPEHLVESLDAMAAAAFSNVSDEVRLFIQRIGSFQHLFFWLWLWLWLGSFCDG
jgi:GTPase-activating protein BEM2